MTTVEKKQLSGLTDAPEITVSDEPVVFNTDDLDEGVEPVTSVPAVPIPPARIPFRQPEAARTVFSSSPTEFYARVEGAKLGELRDIPLRLEPLINCSLRDLSSSPLPWVLEIRQKLKHGHSLSRPRAHLFVANNSRISLNFAMHYVPLMKSYDDFYEALRISNFTLHAHVNFKARPKIIQIG